MFAENRRADREEILDFWKKGFKIENIMDYETEQDGIFLVQEVYFG
jgi:hypothetical protein